MILTAALITGLGLGSMYGLLALGFHITNAVSKTVNFAQGSAMMVGAVLGYTLLVTTGLPFGLALPLTLALCALYGLVIERFLVRPFAERGSDSWLMATVAGGLLVDNIVLFTFGKEPRQLPSALTDHTVEIMGSGVYPLQLLIPVTAFALVTLLLAARRYTRLGKVMEATVQNREAASLMGIPVRRVVAAAFALSSVLAAIAGLLIAPLYSVHADLGTVFGIKAFAVAILGGINSALGVVVAGLLFGLLEATVTATLGSAFTQLISFSVVIVALALMPYGLFGKREVVKV